MNIVPNHPMFHARQPDLYAAILKQLGLPLIARKVWPDLNMRPVPGGPTIEPYGILDNESAYALNLIIDVKSLRFGFPDFGTTWKDCLGSILIVREDKKELTIHHVQALVDFCKHKIDWNLVITTELMGLRGFAYDDFANRLRVIKFKQDEVRQEMQSDKTLKSQFQEYFMKIKDRKIGGNYIPGVGGDTSWTDAVSAYDTTRKMVLCCAS